MFRPLRRFAASLALAGLLALNLHVILHWAGLDNDGGADGCQVCQLALHQQSLQPVQAVQAPRPVGRVFVALARAPRARFRSIIIATLFRGPPAAPNA